jgi:hypothetical protein
MKRIVYTLLTMTVLSVPTSFALAQISVGTNSSTSGTVGVGVGAQGGNVGVGTQGGNVGVGVNTGINADVNADANARSNTNSSSNRNLNDGATSNIGAGVNGTLGVEGTRNNAARRTSNSNISPNSNESVTTNSGRVNSRASANTNATVTTRSANSLDQATIRNIQTSLNQRGYNVGAVDGRWNTNTAAQLRRFEQNQGLNTSSGTNLSVNSLQQLGVRANDINSAAGNVRNVAPSTRVMGGVQGGASYND